MEITSNWITHIPFNVPHVVGNEAKYIEEAIRTRHLSGDGPFTEKCQAWLENNIKCKKAFLTPSCTAALEMAALLINIKPGDEIIMPSYTFVSTAQAFVLRGAIPVFVDIKQDTLNIDETKIETAINSKTRAIVVVHYAGVACEMNKIMAIAEQHKLYVVEDAAQALQSKYNEKPLGSFGHLSAFSFHATKNIGCGEGGALCINDHNLVERAEIIREKGTNRKQFYSGQVDKYSWVDLGSSFLPSEISSAFLYAQLEASEAITEQRLSIWNTYHRSFSSKLSHNQFIIPKIPSYCQHNGHIYYLLLPNIEVLLETMEICKNNGITTSRHYVPLHSSIGGKLYGRIHENLNITSDLSTRILRLPLWIGVEQYQKYIFDCISQVLISPKNFIFEAKKYL